MRGGAPAHMDSPRPFMRSLGEQSALRTITNIRQPKTSADTTASLVKSSTMVRHFDIVADHSIPGFYVTRVLNQAVQFRGLPAAIRTDQGPEFTGRALGQWAYRHGVQLKLIAAGKPTQNAFVESFNGRFRDECLNDHWFESLNVARAVIAGWRRDYNEQRLHSALGYRTPAAQPCIVVAVVCPHRHRSSANLSTGTLLTPSWHCYWGHLTPQ